MGAMPVAQPPPWATLVRAPNPGPMTLDGTNSWVLRAPGATGCVDRRSRARTIPAISPRSPRPARSRRLDHPRPSGPRRRPRRRSSTLLGGRAGRGRRPTAGARGAAPLDDGDRLDLAGLSITVLATPGHTSDSVCLLVEGPEGDRAVLTGDTILGRGTTVVAWPDGDLGAYLTSLDRLERARRPYRCCLVMALFWPTAARSPPPTVRTAKIGWRRCAPRSLTVPRTPAEVVAAVYPDLDPVLVPAAEWTVRAALAYLDPAYLDPDYVDHS